MSDIDDPICSDEFQDLHKHEEAEHEIECVPRYWMLLANEGTDEHVVALVTASQQDPRMVSYYDEMRNMASLARQQADVWKTTLYPELVTRHAIIPSLTVVLVVDDVRLCVTPLAEYDADRFWCDLVFLFDGPFIVSRVSEKASFSTVKVAAPSLFSRRRRWKKRPCKKKRRRLLGNDDE